MKQFLFSCLALYIFQFGMAQSMVTGTLPQSEGRTYHIYLKPIEGLAEFGETMDMEADAQQRFAFELPIQEAGFYQVSIISMFPDGNKANYNAVIYMKPKAKLFVPFLPKEAYGLASDAKQVKDANNRLLLEAQESNLNQVRALFMADFEPQTSKQQLQAFYSIADSLTKKSKAQRVVKDYVQLMAFNEYNANMYRMGMALKDPKDPQYAAFYQQPRDPKAYFNNPATLSLYTGISSIVNYLDLAVGLRPYSRRKDLNLLQKQVAILKQTVTHTEVVDQVVKRMLENYISGYKASDSFEADLQAFQSLANQLQQEELRHQVVDDFENLRFTLKGADWVNFEFVQADLSKLKLDDLKGKYVFIDVWASWCVPCIKMIPHLQELEKAYEGKNITFVALSIDEDQEKWAKKRDELGLHGYQLWDASNTFAKLMNITGIPHYLLYDPAGKLIHYQAPAPNSAEIRKELDKLLAK